MASSLWETLNSKFFLLSTWRLQETMLNFFCHLAAPAAWLLNIKLYVFTSYEFANYLGKLSVCWIHFSVSDFFFSNFSHNPSTLKNLEFWILFSKPSETAANANLFLAVLYLFFTVRISNSLRGSVASNIEFIALLCFHSPEDLVPHKRWILFSNVLIKKF